MYQSETQEWIKSLTARIWHTKILSAVCPRQNILRKQWSSTGRCRKGSRTISRMLEVSCLESYGRDHHYNDSRYHMLNYHATFTKGTVEFRLFQFDAPADGKLNGLHAGQLKSYIQLCLALSQMAKEVRTASPKPQQTENPKYAMRTWLLRLGFIGDEFKTARDILTKRLAGDTAFRSGRAA